MLILGFGVFWLSTFLSCASEDHIFETEKYVSNVPSTLRSCSQQQKHWQIFDSLREVPFCKRLKRFCMGGDAVGGSPAKNNEFPHIAAIGWRQSDNTTLWDCGGILITENIVMTAGHCTYSKPLNSKPNIIRLGEIRCTEDTNRGLYTGFQSEPQISCAEQTQYFGIKKFIKHPNYSHSSRYDDIALLELDKSISTNKFVLPACLWSTFNFNFRKLDAAGWGIDQYGGNRVKELTKVTLTVVSNSKCNEFYSKSKKMKVGLKDTQLCADDPVMDTCQGDSGGPLEIKLYANGQLIPFVVGITSFGSVCGGNIPGVYTRVSSYIPWIENVVNVTFDPIKCSIRNNVHRDTERNNYYVEDIKFESSVTIINDQYPTFKCGGSVITTQFVLTSTLCFNQIAAGSKIVILYGGVKMNVESATVHPMYDDFYNDLALVKLESKIRQEKITDLVCVAPFHFEQDQYKNYKILNKMNRFYFVQSTGLTKVFEDTDLDNNISLNLKSKPVPPTVCADLLKSISNITRIDDSTQLCAGDPRFAVPGFCQNVPGGPWMITFFTSGICDNQSPSYLVGVQSFGADCGFGIPTIATRVAAFVPWIDSVVYPMGTGETNREIADEFAKCIESKKVDQNVEDITQGAARFESIVLIGYVSNETSEKHWICDGVIIAKNFILTTARCVMSVGLSKIQLLVSPTTLEHQRSLAAKQVHVHRDYSATSGDNDIAMIVTDTLVLDKYVVPACPWYNTTHLPFELQKVVISGSGPEKSTALVMNPFGNDGCTQYFKENTKITEKEFCVTIDGVTQIPEYTEQKFEVVNETFCSESMRQQYGETILHFIMHPRGTSAVVVGLSSAKNSNDLNKPLVFTRVSAYHEWIENTLKI